MMKALLLVSSCLVALTSAVIVPVSYSLSEPAITSQSANILRSPGNLAQISTYSKTIDTPYSSTSKSDVRVSKPGVYSTLSYAAAPAQILHAAPAIAHYAATPVAHYAAPAAQYAAPADQYVAPAAQYGAPASQYAAPAPQYAGPAPQYAAPGTQYAAQYSAPAAHYAAPIAQYAAPIAQYSAPIAQYAAPAHYTTPAVAHKTYAGLGYAYAL